MGRLVDFKPEAEAVIVERLYRHVQQALAQEFAHREKPPKARGQRENFALEERTLITEQVSLSSRAEPLVQPAASLPPQPPLPAASARRLPPLTSLLLGLLALALIALALLLYLS